MKIKTFLSYILAAGVLFNSLSYTQAKRAKTPAKLLRTQLDQILNDTLLSPCFVGVKIISLEDGGTVYEKNSNKLFHPASNMKLFTTSAAINLLDSNYQYITKVYAEDKIANDTLHGNLYIKGSGDPLLTTNDFDSLALLIKSFGIQSITGDLVGDISHFDALYWGRGWMWDDEPESDEAFISPLTVNGNSFKIFVKPGQKVGDSLSFTIDPATSYIKIANQGVTSNDTLIPNCSVTRPKGENKFIVTGRLMPTAETKEFALSVWKPEMYFLNLFKERLILQGIKINGKLEIDSLRGSTKIVEVGHPIDSVLHQINKMSDNLAAENLLKTLAAVKAGEPGTATNGVLAMKEFLAGVGIDTTNTILVDGSGVSWYNEISPNAIVQLLQKQYAHKSTFRRFYESLPIAGIDGTLKNRMKGTAAEGNVHAKTGSLTGVSGLSGYTTSADRKLLAFSIVCNHFPGELKPLRDIQDKILELLAKSKIGRIKSPPRFR